MPRHGSRRRRALVAPRSTAQPPVINGRNPHVEKRHVVVGTAFGVRKEYRLQSSSLAACAMVVVDTRYEQLGGGRAIARTVLKFIPWERAHPASFRGAEPPAPARLGFARRVRAD